MKTKTVPTIENPDLGVAEGGRTHWNTPETRRWGFHNLHRITRYGLGLRSRNVMVLQSDTDCRIAEVEAVHRITSLPIFSGLAVVRGNLILHEQYASDFGPDQLHSIQSITKTAINLIYGRIVAQGDIDLDNTVGCYLP